MKLSQKDLSELRSRQQMMNQYNLVVEALKDALQVWISQKLKEYKCEDGKKFNISFENGKINEIK